MRNATDFDATDRRSGMRIAVHRRSSDFSFFRSVFHESAYGHTAINPCAASCMPSLPTTPYLALAVRRRMVLQACPH